nr:GMC family oxidoreductase [Planctomycetota bacterium]
MAAAGHWDWIVIGSGFGGSVCALRLAEKGYRVLVLEQGRRLRAGDFPRSNWNLKRWLWAPRLGFRGPFRISFMRHLTAFSGVGVGGGSLIYANTLPQPAPGFFRAPGWSGLADWKRELEPHYATALRMLGAIPVPELAPADRALREVARATGREADFAPTRVAVYFGQPGVEAPDPYFDGQGPPRTGCTSCGGCIICLPARPHKTLRPDNLPLPASLASSIPLPPPVVALGSSPRGLRPSPSRRPPPPPPPLAFSA